MSREQVFDSEIKKFFDICVKILESHSKAFLTLNANSDSHVLRNLQRYRTVYNMTNVQTHIPYFQKLFRNYRDEILNVLRDDKWLQDENVVIQFGEELEDEDLRKRSAKRKIEISTIYKYALQLRTTVEESLKGLPDSAHQNSQELIYPEIFLFHLSKILTVLYPQNKELLRNVQSLEKELGVSETKKTGHPLESIAENAKQLLSGVLPGNLKIPSNEELNQKLETAFKDPLVSETLGNTVSSLMNAKNLGEGLGMAMKSLENPKFMDGLMRAVQTIIPPETLETIVKSTESLKESGEMKDALGKLGLGNGDVDIGKTLGSLVNNLNLSDLAASMNLPSDLGDQKDSVPETVAQTENSSKLSGLQIPDLSKLSLDDALSTLMKSVPPELLEALTKQQNLLSQGGSDRTTNADSTSTSLIDL
jgi:hypothetical protein